MKVISFINHKGGIGKTSSALNVGYSLKSRGYRTLLIDMDSQSNLTLALGLDKNIKNHVGKFIEGELLFEEVVKTANNLDILPASKLVAKTEKDLGNQPDFAFELKERLDQVKDNYDFCIIDCPPSLGVFVYMVMVTSSYIFIPMQPEFFAFEGLENIVEAFNKVKKHYNPGLKIGGVFFTKYNPKIRNTMYTELVDTIKEQYNELVLKTSIRENVKIGHAQIFKTNLFELDSNSNGAKDYDNLTTEILERIK
ncbi:ParA family protein [Pontibacter silvestris]|uniref:ParA family protein n=1 Tax=Pontibacter silvestris TaxID=2305183 RepID=A0ABW4X5K4_9BACT|nr:ParA family protein [Pontibacter silvestris]MCC9138801.1 ParA family protein [Pontibacter silvestris]